MSHHQPAELLTNTSTHTSFCRMEQRRWDAEGRTRAKQTTAKQKATLVRTTLHNKFKMPATRSGSKHTVGPQHHGRHAKQNGVFSNNKREVRPRRTTRFQTGQREVKRINLQSLHLPLQQGKKLLGWKGPQGAEIQLVFILGWRRRHANSSIRIISSAAIATITSTP